MKAGDLATTQTQLLRTLLPDYRKQWEPSFREKGHAVWKERVAGKEVTRTFYPQDLDNFAQYDTSFVWTDEFPQRMDVLTVHGMKDTMVPPSVFCCLDLGTRLTEDRSCVIASTR